MRLGGRTTGDTQRRPGIRQRARYRFDNLLARGTSATLIWLGVVTLAAVALSGLLLAVFGVTFTGGADTRWYEDMWQSMLRVMDPGTMAGDVGWGRRFLALIITVFGLLVAGTLIGIIAAGVEDRIENMRRGRSVVIETDHVVVLGASDRLPVLLRQLVLAGAEGGSRTIVVLADIDPADLHAIAQRAGNGRRGVRIVYRFGDPRSPGDLALVRLGTARAAVVLSDQQSDVAAVETVLAIAAEPDGVDDLTVVVELLDQATARRLHRAFGTTIHSVVPTDIIDRTTAFALRQRGLSHVVHTLLDFRGSDLHLLDLQLLDRPDLGGMTFGALVRNLDNARPIGVRRSDGSVELAPSFDTRVGTDDRVIVIADDVEGIEVSDRAALAAAASTVTIPAGTSKPHLTSPDDGPIEERLVVIGWNHRGREVLEGWAAWAATTSTVELLLDPDRVDLDALDLPDLGPIPIVVTVGDDAITATVDRRPTTIVMLAVDGESDASDMNTILDVQALRRELTASGVASPRLVVELHDARHEPLVDLSGADDFVISDALGSQSLAQLVDQPWRRDVLLELYAPGHAMLRLVSCTRFDLQGERSVADIIDVLAAHGLLLIGWRRPADAARSVALNPRLSDRVHLMADDELVVIG